MPLRQKHYVFASCKKFSEHGCQHDVDDGDDVDATKTWSANKRIIWVRGYVMKTIGIDKHKTTTNEFI